MGDEKTIHRRDIEFDADGTTVRGWLYRPDSSREPLPIIVMAGGFACIKEMHLDKYAAVFARAGLAVLVFDFRNLGASDGVPRQELNPWQQIEDYRHAITYAMTLPFVDGDRIGVWGTSYSGGHVLAVGATDRRVKCVVAQVPTISGHWSGLRRVPMNRVDELNRVFAADRVRRMKGQPPGMRPIAGDSSENPIYTAPEVRDWFLESAKEAPAWQNEVTLRTLEYSRGYEPGIYIPYISPTPLLMIVGQKDYITCTDLQLEAFNHALEPKKLVLLSGGHFAPYTEEFEQSSTAAVEWLRTHLVPQERK